MITAMSKTTSAGILAAVIVILAELADFLDDSATTAFQADLVAAQLAVLWGFISAKDNKPTS